jgi:Ser/Thr protein kinase RdoA (MazF antagonist)
LSERLTFRPAGKDTGTTNDLNDYARLVADRFSIQGRVTGLSRIKKGYINRTYRLETLDEAGQTHKYVLQRINTDVFPDTDALMNNFRLTTEHLRERFLLPGLQCGHAERSSVQTLFLTKEGGTYLKDGSGCWRILSYFDGVRSLDIPDSPRTFRYAGKAFGRFVREMADVDIRQVKTVIPNFHNTASRYRDLEKAIAADPAGRVREVSREIAFVRARADSYGLIADALERGEIPLRVCHNDTNLNNILFDSETLLPVAVIDLDTVMPSSPLYDFGDSMRIGTNTAKDDEKDLSRVSCDLKLYEEYARGYLEECGAMLTRAELELLPLSSLIITSEDGIRFLMDHINGDTYYTIDYPGQNLDRSRTQLTLAADMERKLRDIAEILRRIYRDLKLDAELNADAVSGMWRKTE